MVSFLLVVGLLGFIAWLILRVRNKVRRAGEEARAREMAFVEDLGDCRASRRRRWRQLPLRQRLLWRLLR